MIKHPVQTLIALEMGPESKSDLSLNRFLLTEGPAASDKHKLVESNSKLQCRLSAVLGVDWIMFHLLRGLESKHISRAMRPCCTRQLCEGVPVAQDQPSLP